MRVTDRRSRRDQRIARQYKRRYHGSWKRTLGVNEYWQLYDDFFADQDGCCAICDKPWKEGTRRMHLDHCHSTGKFRGLLCYSCNTKLGFVEKFLVCILEYLEVK